MEKSLNYKLIESNYLNVESQDKDRAEAEHKPTHSLSNPFSRPGGTILLPTAPAPMQKESSSSSLGLNLSQGYSQMYGGIVFNLILLLQIDVFCANFISKRIDVLIWPVFSSVNPQSQAFYGGRMTENRLLAVRNATTEALDHLHDSLESCPTEDTEAQDPKGIKVSSDYKNYIILFIPFINS